MKKRHLLSLLVAFTAVITTTAQNPDEILEQHFKAIGQENLLKAKTLKATGSATSMGMETPFTMLAKRPYKLKVIVEFQGTEIVRAYDGEQAWTINPMMGSTAAVDVTGAEAESIKESADLDGMLWNYREKGSTIALGGSEEVNGRDHFVLNLTKSNGDVNRYYIDKENYLLGKIVQKAVMNGMEMEVEVLLSDYTPVDGFKMPFSNEQRYGGQIAQTIKFDKIETGVDLEDALFSKPAGN